MEEKKPNTPRNSTVAVSPEIGKKLERFCASCGITKKDFISLSLDYFQRYGINPAKHESPAKEMEKLIKKNDQVIGFIRKQEQDILRPMLEAITTTEARIKADFDSLAKYEKICEFVDVSMKVSEDIADEKNRIITEMNRMYDTSVKHNNNVIRIIKMLVQHLDEKGKAGLMDRLFG